MSAAGLDISDHSIHFVELERGGEGLVLKKYGEKKIPDGAIVSGEIKKPHVVREILSELKKEHNLQFVYVSLPEQHGYSFKITLPRLRKREIRGGIGLKLEKHVPLAPKEVLFDYTVVSCQQKKNKKELGLGIVATSRKVVTQYLSQSCYPISLPYF